MAFTIGNQNSNVTAMAKKNDRPAAKVWVNVGYTAQDPETGEDVFIGLPMGIALDTIEPRNPGSSQVMQAKNNLHKLLLAAAGEMEPGQEEIIADLQIQIRRVNEREEATAETNPLIGAVQGLSFARKSA